MFDLPHLFFRTDLPYAACEITNYFPLRPDHLILNLSLKNHLIIALTQRSCLLQAYIQSEEL